MTTKTNVMKRLARSMTKSFKDQGHPVPNGAILNALAAADGSVNWHVFVKKIDAPAPAAQPISPRTIFVGIHTHRTGTDVYPGFSYEAIDAIKRKLALDNIELEMPEYKDDGPMTDDEKVSYYWQALSDSGTEWFEIDEQDLVVPQA